MKIGQVLQEMSFKEKVYRGTDYGQRPITIAVILLPAHPASFAHKFLFQRVPACPGMQYFGRLVIKNSVLDSLVCSGDSLILDVASPRTHKPKIVNESLQ